MTAIIDRGLNVRAKELGRSETEFGEILVLPSRQHEESGTDALQIRLTDMARKYGQPFARFGRALLGSGG